MGPATHLKKRGICVKHDLVTAKVVNGQIRCPKCQSLLGKIYYGGGVVGLELKCKSCHKLVLVEARQR